MKMAYCAESLVDAKLIMDYFEAAGIPAVLLHENQIGAFGELPVTYPEVWVKRENDFKYARKIVADFESQSEKAAMHCVTCGEENPPTFDICWQCHSVLVDNQTEPYVG